MGLRPSDPYLIYVFEVDCSFLQACFDGKSSDVGSIVLGKQKFEVITLQFPLCPSSNTFDNRVLQPSCKQISITADTANSSLQQSAHGFTPCPARNSYPRFTVINSNYSKTDARTKCLQTLAWSMNCLCALVRRMCIHNVLSKSFPWHETKLWEFLSWECYFPSLFFKVLENTQTEILGAESSTNPTTLGGLA